MSSCSELQHNYLYVFLFCYKHLFLILDVDLWSNISLLWFVNILYISTFYHDLLIFWLYAHGPLLQYDNKIILSLQIKISDTVNKINYYKKSDKTNQTYVTYK